MTSVCISTRSHAPHENARPEAPLPTGWTLAAVAATREAELPQTRPQADLGNERANLRVNSSRPTSVVERSLF